MNKVLVVYTTLPDRESVEKIVNTLLENHLVACANFWEINSMYWWKRKMEKGKEFALVVKTRPELERPVKEKIMQMHPYSTPLIMSKLWDINDEYWKWLHSVVHEWAGPAVATGALIERERDGKKEILMTRAKKWNDNWTIPGGHVEVGERVEDAVIREVKEETNLDVDVVKLLNVQQPIFDHQYSKDRHFIFLNYLCRYKGGEVKLNHEAEEYQWIEPEEALKLDLDKYTKEVIEDYLKNRS